MYSKTILLCLAMGFSFIAFAQQSSEPGASTGGKPQDESCTFQFTSGSGRTTTHYCVTQNGNISEFSIGVSPTIEFLNSPSPASEGYGFCDTQDPFHLVSYYDYAISDSGNWSSSTSMLKDRTTVVVSRTTADGVWRLVQSITQVRASDSFYGAARITMALTNLSSQRRIAVLQRHANVNAGGTFNDFNNTSVTTTGSAPGNFGLATTGGLETVGGDFNLAFNQTIPDGPDPCALNTHVAQGFFEGDGSSEQLFNLAIPAGKTKVATVIYSPI